MDHHSENHKTSDENNKERFISLQLKTLRYLCIWPLNSDNQIYYLLHKLSAIIRITIMILVSIGQFIQLFFMPNLGLLSSVIDVATLTTSAAFKWVFTIIHVKEFDKLNRVIFDKFLEVPLVGSKNSNMSMKSLLKYKDLLCTGYCVSGTLIMTLWAFTPLLNSFIKHDIILDKHNNASDQFLSPYHDLKMPVNSWLPFSPTWSPLYQIVFLIEYYTFIESAFVYGFQDCYFFTMLYCVSCQMDILCETMKNITINLSVERERRSGNFENLESSRRRVEIKELDGNEGTNEYTTVDKIQYDEVELHNILKQCIEHHTILLKFLRDYEKLSQTMIIVDFLHAIISLSFALLEITVSQNIIEYTKMLLFLVICIWHQFLNNHFGELIIQKQMSIADAAYDLPWVERSPQFKTSMKIMIMRSQQPVILNGLKMYFLCYKTFMEFTKALISYFMVLRTLQEGK
ncbi:hypothetical protein LSTR_LSTR006602 [Laodelphax striatellus]|uniref:Odorant receptor n=1 Tax=Laodelphax striatellus TaxID=195883 RepID=A0A482WZU5_LAOST|nr:hypothetical protein LSTR_LSTR006602 [Laodelphax striatellus]